MTKSIEKKQSARQLNLACIPKTHENVTLVDYGHYCGLQYNNILFMIGMCMCLSYTTTYYLINIPNHCNHGEIHHSKVQIYRQKNKAAYKEIADQD